MTMTGPPPERSGASGAGRRTPPDRRTTAWGAYRGITVSLRARIEGGEFAAGTALPSEARLCAEYRVARNTLRRALDQLAGEGLITVQPGRGRTVTGAARPDSGGNDATPAEPAPPQYRSMAADLLAMIRSGALRPGDRVPSEARLALRYGVARATARHALAELEGAGLVESFHGKGRFVRQH